MNAGYEFWVRMASFLRIFAGAMAFPFLCLLVGRRPPMPVWVFAAFGSIMMLCVATLPVELFGLMLKVLFIPVIALSGVAGGVVLIRAEGCLPLACEHADDAERLVVDADERADGVRTRAEQLIARDGSEDDDLRR